MGFFDELKFFVDLQIEKSARQKRLKSSFVCPPQINKVILEILMDTMLYIRQSKIPDLAKVAASHAHNLPNLIRDFSVMKLRLYWEDDRAFLRKRCQELNGEISILESMWKEHEPLIAKYLNANPSPNP